MFHTVFALTRRYDLENLERDIRQLRRTRLGVDSHGLGLIRHRAVSSRGLSFLFSSRTIRAGWFPRA
jgi:hypothetical protein